MNKNPSIFTQISTPVLKTLKSKFMNYEGTPFSLVQTSHRSRFYDNLNNLTVEVIKQYFNAQQYEVLLMPSGSSMSSLYLNLVHPNSQVYFYSKGSFSIAFYMEMKKYHQMVQKVDNIEDLNEIIHGNSDHNKKIIHYNKIEDGQQIDFPIIPQTVRNNITIIKNINYCFPWSQNQNNTEDIIYFDTQTGFSVPGFTVFLIGKEFLKNLSAKPNCPDMFDYLLMLKMKSVVNTPFTLCTFVLYENIKYAEEHRQKINQQVLSCKRKYQKKLHSLGFKQFMGIEQDPQNVPEASNFIRVQYNQRILNVKSQINQCGWIVPESNTLCFFIQTQNLNPDFLFQVGIDEETDTI